MKWSALIAAAVLGTACVPSGPSPGPTPAPSPPTTQDAGSCLFDQIAICQNAQANGMGAAYPEGCQAYAARRCSP